MRGIHKHPSDNQLCGHGQTSMGGSLNASCSVPGKKPPEQLYAVSMTVRVAMRLLAGPGPKEGQPSLGKAESLEDCGIC